MMQKVLPSATVVIAQGMAGCETEQQSHNFFFLLSAFNFLSLVFT